MMSILLVFVLLSFYFPSLKKKSLVLFCTFTRKSYLCSAFGKRHAKAVESGCSTVGSILGLGPRGRTFESCHPDQQRAFSSAGSEHLPYKQRVGGSNPSTPTELKKECIKNLLDALFFCISYSDISPMFPCNVFRSKTNQGRNIPPLPCAIYI